MIGPFLPEVLTWAAGVSRRVPDPAEPCQSHFGQRAQERGVVSVHGDLLKWAVEQALVARRDDLVAEVFAICPQSRVVRVLLPEGAFYPVIVEGHGATIYNAENLRKLRRGRRLRKRRDGQRRRRAHRGSPT